MQMEEHQPGSAATGRGGMGTDDTTLIERVEPSSFVAAADRLLVHLNSSYSTACAGDTWTSTQSFNVPVEEPQQVEGQQLPRKRNLKNMCSKPGLISEISGFGECFSGVKHPRVQVVGLKQWHGSTRLNPRSLLPI